MEEIIVQAATEAARMAPVRSSTNAKLEDERLSRKNVEQEAQPVEKEAKEPKPEEVEKAVQEMTNYVEKFSTAISFSINSESGHATIIVTDKETGKVIRQIPPEEVIMLNQKMEEIAGLIFDGEV